jgi:uncharacterized membrane protein YoaK (UPF0700 family)
MRMMPIFCYRFDCMLIREGTTRTSRIDLLLASILAFVAGGANSAGYFAYGFFSANMTGNVSLISDNISTARWAIALAFMTIVVMFIVGAFAASLLIQFGKSRQLRNIYALTLLVEAVILLAIGLWSGNIIRTPIVVVGLLSFAMGIQNAASTRISASRVRTTHVSGIATDIGVGLAMLFGKAAAADKSQTAERLQLHCATIVAFMVGGIAGVVGYGVIHAYIFCLFSLALFAVSGWYVRSK